MITLMFKWMKCVIYNVYNQLKLEFFLHVCRYMGIGLSAQGVNMNRLPGEYSE